MRPFDLFPALVLFLKQQVIREYPIEMNHWVLKKVIEI